MSRRLSHIVLCTLLSLTVNAQTPFKQSYDVVGDVFTKGFHTHTYDGGMILITKSTSWLADKYFTIFKTFPNGDVQWTKRYVQPGNCNVSNIVQLPDSSYFFCFVELNSPEKYYITHLDQNGVLIYCKSLTPPPDYIVAFDPQCIVKSDGNVYVASDLYNLATSMFTWHLFEVDVNGNILFSQLYNAGSLKCLERGFNLCANGDVIMTGYHRDSVAMRYGPSITRIDSDGVFLWSKRYLNTATNIAGFSINEMTNGNLVVIASHTVPGNELVRLETDSAGNLLRSREYGHATSGFAPYTSLRAENNSLIVFGTADTGAYCVKLDAFGNVLHALRYDYMVPNRIGISPAGMYTFSGVQSPSNHAVIFTTDTTLISCFGIPIIVDTASVAFQTSVISFNTPIPLFDTAFALGDTLWAGINVKLCGPIGIEEHIPTSNVLVFPNPANESVTIQSDKLIFGVDLYDITGRQLLSDSVNATSAQLNTAGLPAGCYLLRVHSENRIETKRVIVE